MTANGAVSPSTLEVLNAYAYVDTAFGSVDHRNHVQRWGIVNGQGRTEAYASYQRATDYLKRWVSTHTNAKGNPTVAKFDGHTWTPYIPLDFDAADDPTLALTWLRRVLHKLEAWGVDLRAVRIYFSGHKGFHLLIPHTLFGGFRPAANLNRTLKRAAERLLDEIPFDRSIYDTLRLLRLENSRHGKTNLYKVQLTPAEAFELDLDAIHALALEPRDTSAIPELTPIADDDWMPVDALIEIWQEALQAPDDEPRERHAAAIGDDARDRQTTAAIAAGWPYPGGSDTRTSRHTDYLMPVAGLLAGRTSQEHTRSLLHEAAEQAGDSSFLHGREWRAEIERLVTGSAERRAKGEKFVGLPTLMEQFPALGTVLAALWPATKTEGPEQTAEKTAPRLVAVDPMSLLRAEPLGVPWLVQSPEGLEEPQAGLLAEREALMIAGGTGIGKTFLEMELAVAGMLGDKFLHHFPFARPLRFLVVDEESSLWLWQRRLPQIIVGRGISEEQYRDEIAPRLLLYVDQGFTFDDEQAYLELIDRARDHGTDVALFDSLSRIHRRGEKDNSEMAALFSERIKPFMRLVGCSAGFLHHPRKLSREAPDDAVSMVRGASDLVAQLDQLWFLRGKSGDDRAIFEHAKCRPAKPIPSFMVRREDTEDGGVRITHHNERDFTVVADQVDKAKQLIKLYLSTYGQTVREALIEHCSSQKIGKRSAEMALTHLIADKEVTKPGKFGRKQLYDLAPEGLL